jgi:hypothetical protein
MKSLGSWQRSHRRCPAYAAVHIGREAWNQVDTRFPFLSSIPANSPRRVLVYGEQFPLFSSSAVLSPSSTCLLVFELHVAHRWCSKPRYDRTSTTLPTGLQLPPLVPVLCHTATRVNPKIATFAAGNPRQAGTLVTPIREGGVLPKRSVLLCFPQISFFFFRKERHPASVSRTECGACFRRDQNAEKIEVCHYTSSGTKRVQLDLGRTGIPDGLLLTKKVFK